MLEKDIETTQQFKQILDYGYEMGKKVDISMNEMIRELSKELKMMLQQVDNEE